jgi:hypothetical protein
MLQPFPVHGDITRVLQLSARRSYAYGKGRDTTYDYPRVEEFLFGECAHGRPLINPDPAQLRYARTSHRDHALLTARDANMSLTAVALRLLLPGW